MKMEKILLFDVGRAAFLSLPTWAYLGRIGNAVPKPTCLGCLGRISNAIPKPTCSGLFGLNKGAIVRALYLWNHHAR